MSKSKARLGPAKLFAHDEFMDRARREKRVTRTEISMKHLKPDTSLQARVNTLDMENVRKLQGVLKDGMELQPIVVFDIGEHEYKIADGFHRHEAVRRDGRPAITCDVIKGTLQEAIEYAASCNRDFCLPRQQEDIKKAVYMLLENGWLDKAAMAIADQVGCSDYTVTKCRALFCDENAIKVPDVTYNRNGVAQRRGRKQSDPAILYVESRHGRRQYQTRAGGRKIYLGTDKEEAERRLDAINAEKHVGLPRLAAGRKNFAVLSARRGVAVLPISTADDTALILIAGYRTAKTAVSIWEDHQRPGLLKVIAEVHLIAAYFDLPRKVVIKQSDDHAFQGLIEVAGKLGVEFMTLDEFIASEKDAPQ